MCADEPDKNSLYSELYYNYESVTIAFDVEHIPLIADAVGTSEYLLDIDETCPFGIPDFVEPVFQRNLAVRSESIIFNNLTPRNNSHARLLSAKLHLYFVFQNILLKNKTSLAQGWFMIGCMP